MIHIYTGNGKGKTTAALGLALRAAGHKMHSYIGQFIKERSTGEIAALSGIPFIIIEQFGGGFCSGKNITPEQIRSAHSGLNKCKKAILSGKYRLVVMDEINIAVHHKLLPIKDVEDIMDICPDNVELILTGRYADEALIEKADLVSEIREIKHYFTKNLNARQGIEY